MIADVDGSHRGDFGYYEYIVGAVCEGRIFALLRDGNGSHTQCYRYEVSDPEKRTLLYETAEISAWYSIRADICT